MKILLISRSMDATPPHTYGPAEQVTSDLAEELVALGHEVTLFATKDSQTQGKLVYHHAKPIEGFSSKHIEHFRASVSFAYTQTFDIVHNHEASHGLRIAQNLYAPHVTTMCWLGDNEIRNFVRDLSVEQYKHFQCVAISHRQREILPYFNWIGMVYNGIRVESFPFQEKKENFLLFLGRIAPEKGPDIAIRVAKAVGIPLIIAGKLHKEAQAFFDTAILPHVDGHSIQWIGPADQKLKRELLAKASTLLMPIQWEEAFGLVMIEAMACGTPVVAFARGSVPEIVLHKTTGFIAHTVQDFINHTRNVSSIRAWNCRDHVQKYFSVEGMAKRYVEVYQKAIYSW